MSFSKTFKDITEFEDAVEEVLCTRYLVNLNKNVKLTNISGMREFDFADVKNDFFVDIFPRKKSSYKPNLDNAIAKMNFLNAGNRLKEFKYVLVFFDELDREQRKAFKKILDTVDRGRFLVLGMSDISKEQIKQITVVKEKIRPEEKVKKGRLQKESEDLKKIGEEIEALRHDPIYKNSSMLKSKYLDWRVRMEELFENYYLVEPEHVKEFKASSITGNAYTVLTHAFPTQHAISRRVFREMSRSNNPEAVRKLAKVTAPSMISSSGGNNPNGKIFISHNCVDKDLAEDFIQMFTSCSVLQPDDFVCASVEGSKLTNGEKWTEVLQNEITGSILVIALVTEDFHDSSVSYWEVGIAHASGRQVVFLLKDPVNVENCGDFINTFHHEKLENEDTLDDLKDRIQELREITIKTAPWNRSKRSFLTELNQENEA